MSDNALHSTEMDEDTANNVLRWELEIESSLRRWRLAEAAALVDRISTSLELPSAELQVWLEYFRAQLEVHYCHFDHALSILGNLVASGLAYRLRARVLLTTAETKNKVHVREGTRQQLIDALALFSHADDLAKRALTFGSLAEQCLDEENHWEAFDYCRQGLECAEKAHDEWHRAALLRQMGAVYRRGGDRKQAQDSYNQSLQIRQQIGDESGIADCWNSIALLDEELANYESAYHTLVNAVEIEDRLSNWYDELIELQNCGRIAFLWGKTDVSLGLYARCLTIIKRTNLLQESGTVLQAIGDVYQALGDHDKALKHYEQALQAFHPDRQIRERGMTLHTLGNLSYAKGDHDGASKYYSAALELEELAHDRRQQARILLSLGEQCLGARDFQRAKVHFERALRLAHDVDDEKLMIFSARELSEAYESLKDFKSAVLYLKQSVEFAKKDDQTKRITNHRGRRNWGSLLY